MAIAVERRQLSRATVLRRSLISRDRLVQIGLIAAILLIWQYIGEREGDFFLAPPTSVIDAFGEELRDGAIWGIVGSTVSGVLIGFAIAAVIGVTIGTLMGTSRAAAKALNPLISAGYVVPEAAMVPLLIIWFGLGMTPRVISVVLFAVFEIIVSTYAGVRNVDPVLGQVARSFGASRAQLFRRVTCMAALPYIFAGLRMGAARAVKGMVVAELLFAATGVGGAIQDAANAYQTDKVMVYVIVVTLIGVGFAGLVQLAERLWMRSWNGHYADN
ncbi:ABC transporter permease [Conexibacter sp. CPCC 206217]|uniref:ABC transporter permease n=1 Tax=Conexibacter sp. CPCC 206217 TaxID=3064574 RepID=UPI00272119A8|nr:ABC transporter permease [Conexibacter sp. CPCC 206217]MDO8212526.1 ABC transporter permease [Conexibacter sp. CPCC 206217]